MDSEGLFQKPKKRLYLSHDHLGDGQAYETFKRIYSSLYDTVRDQSLEREFDSDDGEAFVHGLRESVLRDCACLVVLCGARTREDRFVDWEIKAALDKGLALMGILFPGHPVDVQGQPILPDRLQANFDGGFAVICRWHDLISTRVDLGARLQFAQDRQRDSIQNTLPLKTRGE